MRAHPALASVTRLLGTHLAWAGVARALSTHLAWLCLAILPVACGDIHVKPQGSLPKPLIVPLPAAVGLVIPADTRHYVDQETRYGIDWKVDLGPGEVRHLREMFQGLFQHVEEFRDVESARTGKELKAIFEAHVDQYSFVTSRETGGRYFAVTIRYRINLYTPEAEKVDSYTLTGYGNALAHAMAGDKPLNQATVAAMRDAAAKFLVQFPEQPLGQRLARNEVLIAEKPTLSAEAAEIEAVPIDEPADSLDDNYAPVPPPPRADANDRPPKS
jgi:hypothetical protein